MRHSDLRATLHPLPPLTHCRHRIQKLKDMGMNGWRTAHNAPNPGLLDAADRIGFLVWDETHRNNQDDELTTLVLRDRNHPSVILWSVCNEYLCETANTAADVNRSVALFHTLDPRGGRVYVFSLL